MRTFIALELPEDVAHDAEAMARSLGCAFPCKVMPQQNMHLTLAFIGEIGEAQASDAIEALEAACVDVAPIELKATQLGKFGRKSDATVWLGFEGTPELMGLAESVRKELAARELPFDQKAFKPHVTLARRAQLPSGPLPELEFPLPAEATRVTLFRSRLERDGAHYKPLTTVVL